jgi:hypothetical protein
LKRRNTVREQKKEKDHAAKKKASRKSKSGSTSNLETPRGSASKLKEDDDDMDIIGAQADDEEQDFIRNVCEKEVLSVENLLGMFVPLIKDICSSPTRFPDPKVLIKNYVSLNNFSKTMLKINNFMAIYGPPPLEGLNFI